MGASRDENGLDLLYGAAAISRYMFGTEEKRRKVYGLAASGVIPTFKIGAILCSRRSRIATAVALQESAAQGPAVHSDRAGQHTSRT